VLWTRPCGRATNTVFVRQENSRVARDNQVGGCDIKGNISVSSGERIYHMPSQDYYDETRIDFSKGERWFCSESEARSAGNRLFDLLSH
jgi:hypothetical protein